MHSSDHSVIDVNKILEKLFIYADNKDLNINRMRNLIVNPQMLRVLLHQISIASKEEKIAMLIEVSQIYMRNSLNPCILWKRDREIMEFNHSIFDELISFIFTIKVDIGENQHLLENVRPLLAGYPVSCGSIKNIVNKIANNFYAQKFNPQKLQLCLMILSEVYKNQAVHLQDPKCFFFMYGPNSGIHMINQQLKWTLFKGFYFYLGFYIEGPEHQGMNLLSILVNDDAFELSVDENNYLKVKVFSASKLFNLRKLQPKKWYYLKLSYCLRTGIIRNCFQLVAYIEGDPFELRDLPIPSPSMKDNIQELVIGHEIYGKVNYACVSRDEVNNWPKNGINNWRQIESLFSVNKTKLKDIFLFYSPLITTQLNENDLAYEMTNRNHAELLENTAIFNNPFDEVDINYYGGLYTIIPFFNILRFYKYEQYSTALEEMLNLVSSMFHLEFLNIQSQAVNCHFFSILAQFMNQIDHRYITVNCIEIIRSFKDCIDNKRLRRHFFEQFLWKIDIGRIEDVQAVDRLFRVISEFYFMDFQWAIELMSLSNIIWYILDNCEPEDRTQCCMLHYWEQNPKTFDAQKIYLINQQYKGKCTEIKHLLTEIIRRLCKQRKFYLFRRNAQVLEMSENRDSESMDIFHFLIYDHYSICFKKMIMECLLSGILEDPLMFVKETSLLRNMYHLLAKAELEDEIAPVIRILNQCIKAKVRVKDSSVSEIVQNIGLQLDKLYMNRYAAIRLRSRSQGLPFNKRLSQRKLSGDLLQSNKCEQKEKEYKQKIITLKEEKKRKISNDKELFDLIMSICCFKDIQSGEFILIEDEYVKIIHPYFKICCSKFRVKLIEMVRTTVLIKSKEENLPPRMSSLSKFDQVYRFILSEFILKELDPEDPEYQPSQYSNYVIRNFFFIVDHVVISLKDNFDGLYMYIIRLIGLLEQAKKDIRKKTDRSQQQILMATKVCVRKFVLRVLNYAEKSIQNLSNMVFLVYLVVFNNSYGEKPHIFDYFSSLQSNFFIGPIQIENKDEHLVINQNIFIDEKIILSSMEPLKLSDIFSQANSKDSSKKRKHTMNLIEAYLQNENSELQQYLFTLRKIFLSKSQFKEIGNEENRGIRSMFSSFIDIHEQGSRSKEVGNMYELHVSQIIALLLSLCIEASVNTRREEILRQSLNKLEQFVKSFLLACSRDCLKKSEHKYRQKTLPKNVVYHLIHFLYYLLQNQCEQSYKTLIEVTIINIVTFLTILMTVLSKKAGNPETLEDVLMLCQVMQDVEQFNYFSFNILLGVITLGEIKMFSTLPEQKIRSSINHPSMKKHFQIMPKVFIEKHVKQVVEIHKINIDKICKELVEKFVEKKQEVVVISSREFYSPIEFEEFIVNHARKLDLNYRQTMKIWRKIWKRLRLYHYYWSVSMNQREDSFGEWSKTAATFYRHKFSKYMDLSGCRPILQVEPIEPWHVHKAQLDQQVEYRAKNFMTNLYKSKSEKLIKPKSFIDKLFRKSAASNSFMVFWIKHNSKRKGRLSLTKQKLIFEYDSTFQKDSHVDFTSFTLAQYRPMEKVWPLVLITNIIRRRYLMKQQCLLIEFEDSTGLIFNFLNSNTEEFLQKIEQIQSEKWEEVNFLKANQVSFYTKKFRKSNYQQQIDQATELWQGNKITNLNYLMIINKYSGRSPLDPVNYPVVPWVISNFDCKEVIYRDLSKTLGALGAESRKQFYISKYQSLDPFNNNIPPYQLGTHYSSPGVVFNFLVRISPYTEAARTLQGGKFDLSDRLFSSIKMCWHSVTTEVSDVRQLLPQFYYLPQCLINIENHDFGLTQLRERVHNVRLPIWSTNPYQFITKHRRALQSDEVSMNINNWIDLIFGYKQKGKLARQNINLYYYLTYENSVSLSEIEDDVQRTSIEAQIIHFGQTPSQIFNRPHCQRSAKKSVKFSETHKIKFLGLITSMSPIIVLGGAENGLIVLKDSNLVTIANLQLFQIKSEVSLLRNTSKQNLYHIEDLNAINRVCIFGNNRFVAMGAYVNGDLVIYETSSGKKMFQKKGFPKSIIYVNKAENLLFCGCKNGLLEVMEIVYSEKQLINLLPIISEYYIFPIEAISEGAGFFAISAGNLVVINKITRGLSYVHNKVKMQGSKMIRSFESKRKVSGAYICANPLYCVVLYNILEVYIYSINGQFLKSRQIQSVVNPITILDNDLCEHLVVLQTSGLMILKIPELQSVLSMAVPQKEYTSMKAVNDKIYLLTNNGEILLLLNYKDLSFS